MTNIAWSAPETIGPSWLTHVGPSADSLVHLDLHYGFFDRPGIP